MTADDDIRICGLLDAVIDASAYLGTLEDEDGEACWELDGYDLDDHRMRLAVALADARRGGVPLDEIMREALLTEDEAWQLLDEARCFHGHDVPLACYTDDDVPEEPEPGTVRNLTVPDADTVPVDVYDDAQRRVNALRERRAAERARHRTN